MINRYATTVSTLLVAVLVLGACGSEGTTAVPADTSGTLPGVASTGPLPPSPIHLANGGSAAASPATPSSGDIRLGAETSILPISVADYVVGDGMPALPTNDIGYVFQPGAQVTEEQVAALAAALGITGEPVRTGEGDLFGGSDWQVGPNDGSSAVLYVSEDAQLSWSYSGAWADNAVSAGCAVAVDSAGNTSGECPEQTPPADVPTASEVEQRTSDLLVAVGLDPASYEFETYADEWFASVTAVRKTDDGAPVNQASFGFGADGVMQYASGQLATPVPIGPYPLIGLDAAVAWLKDQGSWSPYPGGIALDTPVIAEEAVPGEKPYGEPVVVTLVDVQADFWWAWDADGSVWLLPAYRFVDTDGGWHVVPAVTDEFMIEVEPVPVPAPLPAETSFDTAPLNSLLGTPLDGFIADAETLGATVRVVQQDGELLPVTLDYSPTRVNVAVEGNLVVAIVNVG